MGFLLISDTYGKLGIINELVAETQADAVIHSGDFGFYEDASYERLSERELRLHIVHSTLPPEERERILALPRVERIAASKECAEPAWTDQNPRWSGLNRRSLTSVESRKKPSISEEEPRRPGGIAG